MFLNLNADSQIKSIMSLLQSHASASLQSQQHNDNSLPLPHQRLDSSQHRLHTIP